MKLGIFAKTFSRPTVEELFQSIAAYRTQFRPIQPVLRWDRPSSGKRAIRSGSANR